MHISFIPGLSPWKMVFDLGGIHIGFDVDEVALGQVTFTVLRTSPVTNFLSMLHNHAFYTQTKKGKV